MLSQSTFNYPNLHLLIHYAEQIIQFGTLLQYSTEITESLHKLLKDAYKRSNRVDATVQILASHTRDYAFKMLELNLCVWDKEVTFYVEMKALIMTMRKDPQGMTSNKEHSRLSGQPQSRNAIVEPLSVLTQTVKIPNLIGKFRNYLQVNGYLGVSTGDREGIEGYRGQYVSSFRVALPQFQGDGLDTHNVR
ncbi:hypothetical protein L211DRAFT_798313 [Terfezia boudieri ATCC MYA-4762]|uniref:Uncharacterized protein n=1 Tax=Terfezia boudieri ATCC MYA-4762 TaxID=1051890 RepID=A0A3N4L9G9_9PEZI|nr:hypothetical protein L211DRAFT_798313 [Terfezia boudieri ATCC MYA-4762]